eukprot:Skav232173  [mRNA]  locus=scaffold4749:87610:96248:- [translate_table: standard]
MVVAWAHMAKRNFLVMKVAVRLRPGSGSCNWEMSDKYLADGRLLVGALCLPSRWAEKAAARATDAAAAKTSGSFGQGGITNRAIVLAALGKGAVILKGALWSEDTEAMVDCMQRLGIQVDVAMDPQLDANRIITIQGPGSQQESLEAMDLSSPSKDPSEAMDAKQFELSMLRHGIGDHKGCNGQLPKGGTEAAPLELFVANAGTAARFLSVSWSKGGELIEALRKLGYRVETPNNKLPALFFGKGPARGSVTVSVEVGKGCFGVGLERHAVEPVGIQDSSQFASALLLSSRAGEWDVSIPAGANPDELPYVDCPGAGQVT